MIATRVKPHVARASADEETAARLPWEQQKSAAGPSIGGKLGRACQFFNSLLGPEPTPYELVAVAYRQLVSNFEKVRNYDSSEDFSVGAMEMKRLDPAKFLFAGRLGPYYEKWSWLQWLGERVSVTNLYRLASNYGSSYVQALGVLVFLSVTFALLFTLSGVSPNHSRNAGVLVPEGLIHAVEVATFQSPTRYVTGSGLGWILEQVERPLVAGQVALFLLALRRRFRR